MALPDIFKKEISIVAIGSFNPRIFSPAWYSENNLLRKSEAAEPDVKIINNDLSVFKAGWLDVSIERSRLQYLTSLESAFETLRDLTASTFTILNHTPVEKLGINHIYYFQFKTQEDRDAFGFKLVPKESWTPFCKYIGMKTLEVQIKREDEYSGKIVAVVSAETPDLTLVKVQVNDHYDFDPKSGGLTKLVEILNTNWINSTSFAKQIIYSLVGMPQ